MTDSQPITAIDGNAPIDAPDYPSAVNHVAHLAIQAEAPSDSVVLSVSAQAQLLQQQGLNVAEIASQLGIAVSAVQIDLNIAVASSQASAAKA
jgi:ABC-type Fe2+-enterobactin transport system substrate-binding protein